MENRNWREVKLGDIIDIISKKTPIENATLENYISTENMINDFGGVQNAEKLPTTNTVNAFVENDILFSNIRTYFKKVWHAKFDGTVSQDVLTFRAKENIISKFLYYILCNPEFTEYTVLTSKGAKMPRGDKDAIRNFEIQLPQLPEQKAIASVLSSLDDKIDLLHQQNQTLEALAETLFRQWFIERCPEPVEGEAKEDWEEIKFGDAVTVKRGGSPRPIQDYLSDSGYRWLKISDATKENSPFIFDIKEHIKVEGLKKTTYLEAGKLVLSNSATPGLPKILQVDTCIHDGWLHFPKSKFSNEFLYLFFKKIRPELENMGNGSIFTNLKTDILKEFELRLPDDITLQKFDIIIKDYFDKILINQQQIQTLTQLRDTLLPKLMSGEVRVKV